MSLRNILERELVACSPETPIQEVAQLMDDKDVGAVLICENGEPMGIVTDRDIAIRCVVEGMDGMKTTANDIMTEPVECVTLEDGIFNVVQKMKENQIRRVAVVDESGKAVGLVSFGDMFQLLSKELHDLAGTASPEDPKIVKRAA